MFEQLLESVAYMHGQGVLHRDIKPGNVLVDREGEPRIIDFGVARATDSDMAVTTLQTDVGQLVGTVQYMSPEQARNSASVTALSDVYSLGATLYHLLVGRPPFQASDVLETIKQVMMDEPVAPRQLDPSIDRDMWMQIIPGNTTRFGFTVQFQTEDAQGRASSGFDWWAFGN